MIFFTSVFMPACESMPEPESSIRMNDTKLAGQLLHGFYFIEGNGWRWTARMFSVALKPPGVAANGATLVLNLFVPPSQIQNVGSLTLHAAIDGHPLKSQTYAKPGAFEYTRDIPSELLDTNIVPIDFCLDKATPPSPQDGRELGVVVTAIALRPH
ncbi:MAG: hypothetical protein JO022_05670 [Acidobacteriaceae bacterium]|nr:hypothetical protein [Acidobacteriaceae bacterium]